VPAPGLDDPRPGRGENGVEGGSELGVPVSDEELESVRMIVEVHQQVAGLLGHPVARRAGGNPGQVHAAGAVLDEEQHVQAAKEHGVGVEEVRGQDRLGLGVEERPPGLPGSPGRGIDAGVLEDLPDGRRRDLAAQASQLAVDAPYPQPGLSGAISSTSDRTVRSVLGRPGVRRGYAQ
jgi:hypothetical protein